MKEVRQTYSNGEVTVVWRPALCSHSENCWHGLPRVFDPQRKPWIDAHAASSTEIVAQVARCPSGALSIEEIDRENPQPAAAEVRIEATPNGPLLVHGAVTLVAAGTCSACSGTTALCRCGASKNKPYCDGSHHAVGFKG